MNSKENNFQTFESVLNSFSVKTLLTAFQKLNECLDLKEFQKNISYFFVLKQKLSSNSKQLQKYSKIQQILQKLEKRSKECFYWTNSRACQSSVTVDSLLANKPLFNCHVLVIGGGISGLRLCVELLFLGANVTCVEKRQSFTRNNVIHLWPNVIQDMRQLGAKRLYPQFCVSSIDHVSIRRLQLILLKTALILGLDFRPNTTFSHVCPQHNNNGVADSDVTTDLCQCCCHSHGFSKGMRAHFYATNDCDRRLTELSSTPFDVVVGADGRRNTLSQDFPRKEFRGKLAIAITANFVNHRSEAEVRTEEISGKSYIYHQKWFKDLCRETDIQLENICYYRDETHYYVMTATKQSLLKRKVLKLDFSETDRLLDDSNVDRTQLLSYARDAAQWTTGLTGLEFALNHNHSEDVALFDFTSVYAAKNASRAKRVHMECKCCARAHVMSDESEKSKHVLMLLSGDSLLEPFWPTGSGAGRGFLSALDAAYCAVQWRRRVQNDSDVESMLDVICERESVYRVLTQTTAENVNSKEFSLLPSVRYKNWRKQTEHEIRDSVRHLVGFKSTESEIEHKLSQNKRNRRATVAVTSRDIQRARNEDFSERQISERQISERQISERQLRSEVTTPSLEIKVRIAENECTRLTEVCERTAINRSKADWLLGSRGGATEGESSECLKQNKSQDIVERALNLDKVLNKMNEKIEPKLQKVGKIEENDWNFRVFERNEGKVEEKKEKKRVLENSKEILKSRLNSLERRMTEREVKERTHLRPNKEWIQTLSQELKAKGVESSAQSTSRTCCERETVVRTTPSLTSTTTVVSENVCIRCAESVNAMNRISIKGLFIHRTCLLCQKCGISLRLNDLMKNEKIEFLCIFCQNYFEKRVSKRDQFFKAKEMFLENIEKIDFRERIEYELKSNDDEVNDADDERDDTQTSDDNNNDVNSSSDDSVVRTTDDDTSSDDSDWQTEDEFSNDADSDSTEEDVNETTNNQIPEICVNCEPIVINDVNLTDNSFINNNNNSVTTMGSNNNDVKYFGSFTEKLFRSRSQPVISFGLNFRQKSEETKALISDQNDEDLVPFVDCNPLNHNLVFSPLKRHSTKAPIIAFKDI